MFQSANWPLSSLALLSVDLEAVARRLKLNRSGFGGDFRLWL